MVITMQVQTYIKEFEELKGISRIIGQLFWLPNNIVIYDF